MINEKKLKTDSVLTYQNLQSKHNVINNDVHNLREKQMNGQRVANHVDDDDKQDWLPVSTKEAIR